jgi:hypothetical protein
LSRLTKDYLELIEGLNPERIELAKPQLQKKIKSEVIIEFTSADE